MVLLENVRFHKGETKNDPAFAEQVSHRYLRVARGASDKSRVSGSHSEFDGTADLRYDTISRRPICGLTSLFCVLPRL